MPIRPSNLIRQTVGDNVQQISQAPTVAQESEFFDNIEEKFTTTPGSTITSNIHVYDRSTVSSFEDYFVYLFGDDNGDVHLVRADNGDQIITVGSPNDAIVSVDHRVGPPAGQGSVETLVALSEDGNLYGLHTRFGGADWSFNVGGTPECLVKAEGDVAFVGQPQGLSGEFYSVDATSNGGSANWTYTHPVAFLVPNGFRGGIETDGTYVYAVGGETAFRLDKSSGSDDWENQLDATATDFHNLSKFAFDPDDWYLELNAGDETKLFSVDKGSGSINWENRKNFNPSGNSWDSIRNAVVLSGDRVFVNSRLREGVAAYDKSSGNLLWNNDDLVSAGYNNGDRIDVNLVEFGNVVVASAGPLTSTPGEVVGFNKSDGSQAFAIDDSNDVELALASDSPRMPFGAGADLIKYNIATTGTLGPVRVGSRPFLTLGSESAGQFDVIVYGKNSETGTALKQDTLTMGGGINVEQLPWWSWEWVEFEIDDSNVTAGDTTLYLSASR